MPHAPSNETAAVGARDVTDPYEVPDGDEDGRLALVLGGGQLVASRSALVVHLVLLVLEGTLFHLFLFHLGTACTVHLPTHAISHLRP